MGRQPAKSGGRVTRIQVSFAAVRVVPMLVNGKVRRVCASSSTKTSVQPPLIARLSLQFLVGEVIGEPNNMPIFDPKWACKLCLSVTFMDESKANNETASIPDEFTLFTLYFWVLWKRSGGCDPSDSCTSPGSRYGRRAARSLD
jgi:hypothetical protein